MVLSSKGSRLISVVIPAHNRAHTLGYCLKSVLAQEYSNFEVIVVDDGSTDATRKIAEDFRDPRICVISHELPRGAQAARNTGIVAAQGEWIAFQDSDDEWLPGKLNKQVLVLRERGWNDRLVVHADMFRYFPALGLRELWSLPRVDGSSSYETVLRRPGPVFPTILSSKAALMDIGLLDEGVPSYQEWDTSIRLARICEFVHLQEPLAVYWLHESETISKSKRRDIDGYRYVIGKHREEIIRIAGKTYWYRHLAGLARRCSAFGFFDDAEDVIRQLPILSVRRWREVIALYKAKLATRTVND